MGSVTRQSSLPFGTEREFIGAGRSSIFKESQWRQGAASDWLRRFALPKDDPPKPGDRDHCAIGPAEREGSALTGTGHRPE